MSEVASDGPTVFISYSWSTPEHMEWVISFAQELVDNGVEVVIDKWDLLPGNDANAFMERMVTDEKVTKVIMICDRQYAEKSNTRSGGAGTEAQIITPSIFEKSDQSRFVAVIREKDDNGKPYVPVYYGGRIYIDLEDPSNYPEKLEELVRWIYGKPQYVRPPKGKRPAFLEDEGTSFPSPNAILAKRAIDGLRTGSQATAADLMLAFDDLISRLESFRVHYSDKNPSQFDEDVVTALEKAIPWRNSVIQLITSVSQYNSSNEIIRQVHRFLEKILPYTEAMESTLSYRDVDFDTYKFIAQESYLYIIGTLIKFERFDAAASLISQTYYWEMSRNPSANTHGFEVFRRPLKSLQMRNDRLQLNRANPTADLMHERNKGTGIEYRHILTADFVLYLRGLQDDFSGYWYPDTLIYTSQYGGTFEIFARARSRRYFDEISKLLGMSAPSDMRMLIAKVDHNPRLRPQWVFNNLDIETLSNVNYLGTAP